MINLTYYREHMAKLAAEVSRLSGRTLEVLPVTVDKDMAAVIQRLRNGSVSLFVLPPSTQSTSADPDAMKFSDEGLLFIMERYDPQRFSAFQVLESSQPLVVAFVNEMRNSACRCPRFPIDLSSINVVPETQFYAGFAGWSIGFNLTSYC